MCVEYINSDNILSLSTFLLAIMAMISPFIIRNMQSRQHLYKINEDRYKAAVKVSSLTSSFNMYIIRHIMEMDKIKHISEMDVLIYNFTNEMNKFYDIYHVATDMKDSSNIVALAIWISNNIFINQKTLTEFHNDGGDELADIFDNIRQEMGEIYNEKLKT